MTATAAIAAKYPAAQDYIAGRFVPAGGELLEVLDPSDGYLMGSACVWSPSCPSW